MKIKQVFLIAANVLLLPIYLAFVLFLIRIPVSTVLDIGIIQGGITLGRNIHFIYGLLDFLIDNSIIFLVITSSLFSFVFIILSIVFSILLKRHPNTTGAAYICLLLAGSILLMALLGLMLLSLFHHIATIGMNICFMIGTPLYNNHEYYIIYDEYNDVYITQYLYNYMPLPLSIIWIVASVLLIPLPLPSFLLYLLPSIFFILAVVFIFIKGKKRRQTK